MKLQCGGLTLNSYILIADDRNYHVQTILDRYI